MSLPARLRLHPVLLCGALWALLSCAAWSAPPSTQRVTVAVVSLAGDPRHTTRRMERGYPGHPQGQILNAAQLAIEGSAIEMDAVNAELIIKNIVLPDAQALPRVLSELKSARVQHLVADLPGAELQQLVKLAPAALGGAIVINAGLDDDDLRAAQCAPHLLHTTPSRQMLADALAQYLASKSWRKVLLLQGPLPNDQARTVAFERAARRFGLKIVQTRPFKLSGDPRERDLANTRLLTNDRDHDVVAVMDSHGEFARTLPYATQWPRPVVGDNGLIPMAWHPQWERNGGPQVSRAFKRISNRPMQSQDWAAWVAVRSIASVLSDDPRASIAQQLKRLRAGDVFVDGAKGPRLSYRAWDGQLRQPVFLGHSDGVIGLAPLDGVLHPTEVMDTLGFDEKESTCKARP